MSSPENTKEIIPIEPEIENPTEEVAFNEPPGSAPHQAERQGVPSWILGEIQIVYHGIALVVQKRLEANADKRAERMDHRDALYKDLGREALHGTRGEPTPTREGPPAMPRTIFERRASKRLQKKADKVAEANAYAWREEQSFPVTNGDGQVRVSEKEKKQMVREATKLYKDGKLTAIELEKKKTWINALPRLLGSEVRGEKSKKQKRREKSLNKEINKYNGNNFRSWRRFFRILRRLTADDMSGRHGERAQRHEEEIEHIKREYEANHPRNKNAGQSDNNRRFRWRDLFLRRRHSQESPEDRPEDDDLNDVSGEDIDIDDDPVYRPEDWGGYSDSEDDDDWWNQQT